MASAIGSLAASYGIVFLALGIAGARGDVGLMALTIFAQAAINTEALSYLGEPERILSFSASPILHALRLEHRIHRGEAELPGTRSAGALPQEGIRFDNVHFRYPKASQEVLDGLDLFIPAGHSLAIVGENGAGKTTLVKLLCRLYDPTSGSITIDGIDMREFAPDSWRSRLGVVFQDFVRYELPARENVGFGRLELLGDEEALTKAARSVSAWDLVSHLLRGWDTPLSRAYRNGADLSGGQWQKIALARALLAAQGGAGVLVLDEPTANLDVRAEAELFDRILELTRDVTTILISHRFSSVRRADRIAVLSGGRIVEEGTHDELLAAGGLYARMFGLQATPFREVEGG